jgi:thymidine phosphorylase
MAAVHTGAGRLTHNAELDYGAGVELLRRVGDRVDAGDPVAVLHAATENPKHAVRLLADAFTVGEEPYAPAPVIHRVLANTGRD